MDEVPRLPDFVTISCALASIHKGIEGKIASTTCKYSQFIALEHLYDVSPPIVIKINSAHCFTLQASFARKSIIFVASSYFVIPSSISLFFAHSSVNSSFKSQTWTATMFSFTRFEAILSISASSGSFKISSR